MSDNVELSVSVPLDDDGFLRRECPTCQREFKWLSSTEEESETASDEGYFCPYCGVQAPGNAWWTPDQLERAKSIAYDEVVRPELEKFKRDISQMGSGGFIKASVEITEPDPVPDMNGEPNDMKRVDFPCHPNEPVKVADDWAKEVYCLICGTATS